jgi:hypothetical protein
LLTRLVSQIGWDELLKTRSFVFVMEEEYRMQKAQGDIQQAVASTNGHVPDDMTSEGDAGEVVIHEDGTVVPASMDDQASTRGIISPSTESVGHSPIPTIKISTDDDDDEEEEEEDVKGKRKADESGDADDEADELDGDEEQEAKKEVDAPAPINGQQVKDMDTLEKPVQAAGEGEQNINESSPPPAQEPFSFSNKRLCERWLDNLFMVLYEVRRFPSPRVLP